jgi:predicted secreted hydrolase
VCTSEVLNPWAKENDHLGVFVMKSPVAIHVLEGWRILAIRPHPARVTNPCHKRRPHRGFLARAGRPCHRHGARLFLLIAILFSPLLASEYREAIGPRDWSFPADHGRHEGFKTEWWYFTGNLRDATGREFGYQLTFFRTAFAPQATTRPSPWAMTDLYFAHAAISDLSGRKFLYKDRLERGRPGLAWASDKTLDVRLLGWSARLNDKSIGLCADEPDFKIDLSLTDGRGPILQGPGGVNLKGRKPGQASYYYSMTRLQTAGSVSIDGHSYQITGLSWMDHEFSSNSLSPEQSGWDWMGLQLSDGTDLMIYRMRNQSGGTDYLSGTKIAPDGTPHYLSASDIQMEGSRPWTSPSSGGAYPQQWKVKVAAMPEMLVTSAMPGQELITSASTKVNYFEGTAHVTDVRGHLLGAGYLEMTGYGRSLGGSF